MTPSVSYQQFFLYLLLASLIAWGGVEIVDSKKEVQVASVIID